MDLMLEIGHTLAKIAVYSTGCVMLHRSSVAVSELSAKLDLLEEAYPEIEWCMLSTVAKVGAKDLERLEERYKLLQLTSDLPVPFTNKYESRKTLGVDRIALVSGAIQKYPNANVLVIDAGTCITYDFIDATATYYGGAISPGLTMRYKAMHTFTENLPLLERVKEVSLIGTNTRDRKSVV